MPGNPAWLTVQDVTLKDPKLSAGLMVREKLSVAVAPVESLMVTEPEAKVPAWVGVPVIEIVLPAKVAVRPAGKPLWAVREYEPVPPLSAIVPGNPDWFTVQDVTLKGPKLSAGTTGPPVTSRMRLLPKSAITTSPALSTATPVSSHSEAEVAGPPSPAYPK